MTASPVIRLIDSSHPFSSVGGARPSAVETRSFAYIQRVVSCLMAVTVAGLALAAWTDQSTWMGLARATTTMSVGVATVVYLVVMTAKALVVARSVRWRGRPVPAVDDRPDHAWPAYSILVPLYREGQVVVPLVRSLLALDYPTDRLQVLLLIEHDDVETASALGGVDLPPHFRSVIVGEGGPRTKPRACNLGLAEVTGEYCVIFDAEDRPDADQLKRTVVTFEASPPEVVCLQARLEYWNPNTNGLTRFFAAEYAMNFSLYLPGLVGHGWPVPLGGTSNHFRTNTLRDLGGWDPFNVTEDADLGIWLARRGGRVGLVDSVTLEEANSQVGNWLRQRSRWMKGFMQTWLAHSRAPRRLLAELGWRRFLAFHLVVGGTWFTCLLNPVFWGLTLLYAVTGSDTIRSLYPAPIFYAGLVSLVVGNWLFAYTMFMGCMERGLYRNVKWMLAVPLYWALMSVAAYRAGLQLLDPKRQYYWEKTTHGLVSEPAAGA